MINIYLDDERNTPEGYVRTYTVEDTIDLIKANDGNVYKLSLDNDLGSGLREGKEVLRWIEEQAATNTLKPIPHIIIHTQNSVAMNDMMLARYNAWNYWNSYGYNRKDYL